MSHLGGDGIHSMISERVCMGYTSRWMTSEEVGEQQPLNNPQGNCTIVFDGRIDNRAELLHALKMEDPQSRHVSDAQIALISYLRWGTHFAKRILGPFATVLWDGHQKRVVCTRDPLGDRTLYYHISEDAFVAASEPYSITRYIPVSNCYNEAALAYYFAIRVPHDGATFFKDITELLPAHTMHVTEIRSAVQHYWKASSVPRISYTNDADYTEHFHDLLVDAVRCRLRSYYPCGLMMSGGLDSITLATIASGVSSKSDNGLPTYSWIFDNLQMQMNVHTLMPPLSVWD